MPNRLWETISIDFIVDLLRTQKAFNSIFVIVNRLTKVARFIPTITTMTTSRVAKLFFKEIFVNYGLPREMICDRDKKFVSDFINLCSNYVPPRLV